ncbi:MAG: fibronectin type III domain-containing protein, partial [Thermoplasmata archaeon]
VDYIQIHDAAVSGNVIDTMTYGILETDTFFAIGFNNTADNIGVRSVDWESDTPGVGTVTPTGSSTTFTAQSISTTGTCTVTATYAPGIDFSTGDLTVLAPTFDYFRIEDAAGGYANEITTDSFAPGGTRNYYCARYNATGTGVYIGTGEATWTVESAVVGTVTPPTGTSTQFEATTAGSGYLNATFGGMTKTVTITVTDTIPPAKPTGLTVAQVAAGGALDLSWTANTETDLAGYNIYRSTSADTGFELVNTDALVTDAAYTDSGCVDGTTYYYYIVAVDNAPTPNYSDHSDTASATCDADTDGDNTFNLADPDDDNDGLTDAEEDKNGNGVWDEGTETNPLNPDTDGDGHNDKEDEYPLDASKWKKEEEEFPVALLILPIIIIIILILLFVLLKKRKPAAPPLPEEEMPPEEAPPEEEVPPPEEELPPEEAPPEEEMPPEEEVPSEEAPSEEEVPPPEEEAPPEEDVPPPEEDVPPDEGGIPPPP